jgi:hypothetical protein
VHDNLKKSWGWFIFCGTISLGLALGRCYYTSGLFVGLGVLMYTDFPGYYLARYLLMFSIWIQGKFTMGNIEKVWMTEKSNFWVAEVEENGKMKVFIITIISLLGFNFWVIIFLRLIHFSVIDYIIFYFKLGWILK